MTQKDFFNLLSMRATFRKNGFKIKGDGIREKRTDCCPILACGREMGVKKKDNGDYTEVAEKLGLDLDFAENVVAAADHIESQYGTTLDPKIKRIRNKLLKAVGLSTR